ncbi:hypothetical protein BKP35_12660 [Anaerobacillus arseniciselenatis]|uniref:ABC transporter substrate-binding protein n=1 Tax=Anaerobacillus arseniciselenatis TaxID=85682 RepID=A0A1S2LF38_9BACI|nr:EcsC family protein [Anaerobacillus arseniciselenatis]OIJ10934.1 hypothetical protein BKP35_12660 [Anaerobacillus arseniciselenatis]
MGLTGRKKTIWEEIEKWEQSYFIDSEANRYYSLEADFNKSVETWRPDLQIKLLQIVDSIIFHTHTIAQNSTYDKQMTDKVLNLGRVFEANVENISDMKRLTIDQLRYISQQNLAKQRLISLTQGGVSGFGGIFFVALDLPLMLTINMRSIHLTALTYGYDLNKPYELMLALKVFHVATLPKTMQKEGWKQLLLELEAYEDQWLLFDENNIDKSTAWLQQPIKQLAKGMALLLLKKKLIYGLPIFGITVGAASNYFLAKQVSEIAHRFYEKRYLLEETGSDSLQ